MTAGAHAATTTRWTPRPLRERATLATWRGHCWALVIAFDFYQLSNPLVFQPAFGISLQRAVLVTAVAVVISIPWLRVPRLNLALVVFFMWGSISALWSISPAATMATVCLYITLAALGVVVYANVSGQVLALGFAYGAVLVAALSFYSFAERLPGAFYEGLDGAKIAGIGTNENILAYTVTLGMCGWLALWPRSLRSVVVWLLAGILMLGAVILAESTSGYLTVAATAATALVQWTLPRIKGSEWTRRRRAMWTAIFGGVASACALAVSFSGHGPGTFSDRMPFWRATVDVAVAAGHPMVGYGWGAVWAHPWLVAPYNGVVESIYAAAGLMLTHGHNSFVDLLIETGVVGVVLMMAIVVSILRTVIVRPVPDPVSGGEDVVRSRFVLLCVVDLLIFGITEPMLVIPLGFWAMVLLTEPSSRKVPSPAHGPLGDDTRDNPPHEENM